MKARGYIIAGLVVGSVLTGTSVSAADCSISHTGPYSNNECSSTTKNECVVKNDNTITVNSQNNQSASTGDASSSTNTTGGSATSGNASNSNSSSVNATIDNSGACNPSTPVVPTTPGSGGGSTSSTTTTITTVTPGRVESAQVQVPVGGVGAGVGSMDKSGMLLGLMSAGVVAVGVGLRRLQGQS